MSSSEAPTRFTVRVHPRSREDRLTAVGDGLVEVWTKAPAAEGRANEAVCRLIAQWQGAPISAVRLVSGARGRTKIIAVLARPV